VEPDLGIASEAYALFFVEGMRMAIPDRGVDSPAGQGAVLEIEIK